MTEADIAEIHAQQEAQKANPGIYGKWAKSRDLSMEEIEAKLAAARRMSSGSNPMAI